MSTRRRWVTVLIVIAMMAVTTAVVQTTKATPARATSLPHGTDYRCSWRWYGPTAYRSCRVVVQPGTVADVQRWMDEYSGPFASFFVGLGGVMCAPAGPWIAILCMSLTGSRGAEAVYAAQHAAEQRRCVIVRWAEIPGLPYPINASVKAYGAKQRWLTYWSTVNGAFDRYWYWGNPDSCQTRNPCDDSGSYGGTCWEML